MALELKIQFSLDFRGFAVNTKEVMENFLPSLATLSVLRSSRDTNKKREDHKTAKKTQD